MTNFDSAYYSTKEASDLLGISQRSVQLWVEKGSLKAWKTDGGHRRILRSSVEKILSEKNLIKLNSLQFGQNNRIVIIDNNTDLLNLLEINIKSQDFPSSVHLASDGFMGLILIGKVKPQILIADIDTPNFDVFKMIRFLQDTDLSPKHLFFSTTLSLTEIEIRDDLPSRAIILKKPFSLYMLGKKLQDICLHY